MKPRFERPFDVDEMRRAFNRFAMPAPLGVRARSGSVAGVPGEWLDPGGAKATLLYAHGGAYVMGSPATHRALAGRFAQRGFRVFVPDYRVAPEHPFPAALDDLAEVYRALAEEGAGQGAPVLAGDSAGGGLVLALLLRLASEREQLPCAAAVFSPWTDLAMTGRSIAANDGREPLFTSFNMGKVAGMYLGGADPRTPLASPLYGDFAGLPPLLVHVGERELLLDDATRLVQRAREAGVDVAFRRWPVVPHGWQLLQRLVPEAAQSVDEAAEFLKRNIGRERANASPESARAEAM